MQPTPLNLGRLCLRFLLLALFSFILTVQAPAVATLGRDLFPQAIHPENSPSTTATEPSLLAPSVGETHRGVSDSTDLPIKADRVFSTDNDDIFPPLPTITKNNHAPIAQAPSSFLQDGIRHYQAEQFAAAIQSWHQALSVASTPDLHQALLLSNLSLAHQHLGQFHQASDAIDQSLHILKALAHTSPSADYWETFAKALNARGRLEWTQGDTQSALATWQQTTVAYQNADHDHGIVLSLINQAKALQTLGLHLQSKTILEQQVYQRLQNPQLDPTLRAVGLWHLGNAQRQFGNLTTAKECLQTSLAIIQANHLDTLWGPVLMDLANAERALGDSTSAIGKMSKATQHRDYALRAYGEVAEGDYAPMTQLQAQLNQLSLLIDLEKWSEAEALWPRIWSSMALPSMTLPPSRTAIYAQLNFAKSLTHLMAMTDNNPPQGNKQVTSPGSPLPTTASTTAVPKASTTAAPTAAGIDALLSRVVHQADTLADPIAKSYALGQRGELYELNGNLPVAQALTQKALQLTITNDYPNGRYRWQWQQGRLFKQQQQFDQAIDAYQGAVDTLTRVRKDLRFIDAEVQFSFRDNVEPVYRELVELLLSDDNDNGNGIGNSNGNTNGPSEQNLDQAIQQIDNLQLSELENFLQCSLATIAPINQFKADANTAILYPIILENRLGVISQIQDKKRFTSFSIDQATVEATLKQLQKDLSEAPHRTPKVVASAKLVYDWLIRPLEADLESNQIETLVFVLDGSLRNIPMAVLHNGQQYLLQKYGIAVAPELELFQPLPLPPDLKVFTGGVGYPQRIAGRNFSAIDRLDAELDAVSQLFGSQPPLTNEDFNGMTLQEQLSTGNFSGIHLKTHGVFSSDPEETFIVAYDELIPGQELGNLIQLGSRQREAPIDLLVLSACATATGDNRAVLGLAGIAVRAGARSTLSTLWDAQDEPNTKMMIQFYQELQKDGTTRAQALRRAQLALMKDYPATHVWATYVLVGNWL